ncbi:MAG: hypothetical protein ONA69_00010 [candidate division KSB1 bacterium]|nr:hypothetical protein [candidate division KSB1 bacterium]MDZ7345154.1 hypothetical protein [candidate division KSB1 bacterium]
MISASAFLQRNQRVMAVSAAFALLIFLAGVSCNQRLPVTPPGNKLIYVGYVQGILCNQEAVYQQDIFQDPISKEIISVFQFSDLTGNVFGKAELTAALDLVKLINGKTFYSPGTTTLKIGNWFSIQVTITPPPNRPNYYQIDVQRVGTPDKLTFFVPKNRLGKTDAALETLEVDAELPIFKAALSGAVVLLCLGPCETMYEARDCKINSPAYCSQRSVVDAFTQGRMSLKSGCEKSCRVICKSHDQGRIGR